MRIQGNELTVRRNETFTIDFSVVNRDGTPFVVSSEYKNPYVLVTVSSAKYNQKNRYLSNWWLNLNDMYNERNERVPVPRFKSTIIKRITSKSDTSILSDEPYETVYYNEEDDTYLYRVDDKDGTVNLVEYDFRIIHHFTNSVTKMWVEQSYTYTVYLVSGDDTLTYLRNLFKNTFGKAPADILSTEELYKELYVKNPSLVENINYSRPIVNYDVVQILLEPTKLTVLPDPHGDITDKIHEINNIV